MGRWEIFSSYGASVAPQTIHALMLRVGTILFFGFLSTSITMQIAITSAFVTMMMDMQHIHNGKM